MPTCFLHNTPVVAYIAAPGKQKLHFYGRSSIQAANRRKSSASPRMRWGIQKIFEYHFDGGNICSISFIMYICCMNKMVPIALSLIMLVLSVKDLLYWVGFKMNQRYISRELCVNWDKPELDCAGSCYFQKLISQSKKRELNALTSLPFSSPKQVILFLQVPTMWVSHPAQVHPVLNVASVSSPAQNILEAIFKPPQG